MARQKTSVGQGLRNLAMVAGLALILSSVAPFAPALKAEATASCATGWSLVLGERICELELTTSESIALPDGVSTYDVLLVGGGGGGGGVGGSPNGGNAGGGGGGEVKVLTNQALSGTMDISLGAGGDGGLKAASGTSTPAEPGGDGGETKITQSTTALASAAGGKAGQQGAFFTDKSTSTDVLRHGYGGDSGNGISGGVSRWNSNFGLGIANGLATEYPGGGGGASAPGGAGTSQRTFGGAGLAPTQGLFIGNTTKYGGGGSGGGEEPGGVGGGGDGGIYNRAAAAGSGNTGGGGGGAGGGINYFNDGAAGGSGIVILRYALPPLSTPTITAVSPVSGLVSGQTLLTITGTGFVSGATVSLGLVACESASVVSDTSITCDTGPSAAGLVDVVVTNADTGSATLGQSFTYISTPTITAVSPVSGFVSGSTSITITGTGFAAGATVNVGGVVCTNVVVVPSTSITCRTGASLIAGLVDVVVTNTDTGSATVTNGFQYKLQPATEVQPVPQDTAKPKAPSKDDVKITAGPEKLTVEIIKPVDSSARPITYRVKVLPGNINCVMTQANASCELVGLKPGATYSLSITATNEAGLSEPYFVTRRAIFTSQGLLDYVGTKNVTKFLGNSTKLTAALKAQIKAYLVADKSATAFTCVGFTAGKKVVKSDKALATARGKAICAYILKLRPNATVFSSGKTPGLPWGSANRKVAIASFAKLK